MFEDGDKINKIHSDHCALNAYSINKHALKDNISGFYILIAKDNTIF